jgi:hypothetical protein
MRKGNLCNKLWDEAANTATTLEVMQVKKGEKCGYEKFYEKKPKILSHLKNP